MLLFCFVTLFIEALYSYVQYSVWKAYLGWKKMDEATVTLAFRPLLH